MKSKFSRPPRRSSYSVLKRLLQRIWEKYDRFARRELSEAPEWETGELEHLFGLLVLGSWVGLPAPPPWVTLELLPCLEKELELLWAKAPLSSSALSDLASHLNVD
jgi:hypothetical protein